MNHRLFCILERDAVDLGGSSIVVKKHPRDLTDADVDALVAAFDDAVEQGRVRLVDGVVFRELRAAAAGRRAADERLEAAVVAAKNAGLSWGTIGAQLGVTRQGARQRYERLIDT